MDKEIKTDFEISRVAFRPPPFWEHDPEIWFVHIESQFSGAGISEDSTKYHALVSALDSRILSQARDIVLAPPRDNAYTALKARIISLFSQSENARLRQLLQDLHLGDLRPSQLLSQMKSLAGDKISAELLRTLWLQRLPIQMQQILSACKDELPDLASIADKVHEVSGFSEANAVSLPPTDSVAELRNEIQQLRDEVQRLALNHKEMSFLKKPRSRSASRTRAPVERHKPRNCWYHWRFGDRARKCVAPCNFSGNSSNHR
ncbi:hypothetical protein AVEN_173623-1 [Araneus ventricosus]|uniref:DUF7041 domain-containing protein n=1 Tax=Araneus ventricosus TaxID=182803 RepID=A0A4Y2MNR5_ARAVE|nr:hypothetical protein AVEN_196828-1 [Araneus ventricosus]GBN28182.1 hypothetical protein AVEN_173623-1 [Araneus ventricosus]